jgi:hypothetical protein
MIRSFVCIGVLGVFAIGCGSNLETADGETGGGGATASSSANGSGQTTGAGGEAPGCDPPAGAGAFDLGTGEKCFEALTEGQTITMIEGPQGGYHLWMAVGCTDCVQPAHLRYGADDPATGMPIHYGPSELYAELKCTTWPQKAGVIVALPGLSWDPEYDPPLPKGTPVLLWVEVVEGETVLHRAEIEIVIGETVYWDPCVEDPNHELCGFG